MVSVFNTDSILNIHLFLRWCPLSCIYQYLILGRTYQIAERIEKIEYSTNTIRSTCLMTRCGRNFMKTRSSHPITTQKSFSQLNNEKKEQPVAYERPVVYSIVMFYKNNSAQILVRAYLISKIFRSRRSSDLFCLLINWLIAFSSGISTGTSIQVGGFLHTLTRLVFCSTAKTFLNCISIFIIVYWFRLGRIICHIDFSHTLTHLS